MCPTATSAPDLRKARIAVFGDFALDAHWSLAAPSGERSVETGLEVRRVAQQRYEPGGAARVAENLCALRVQRIRTVGWIGKDLFGRELLSLLDRPRIRTKSLLKRAGRETPVYGKPTRDGVESERLDFGATEAPDARLREDLLHHLAAAARASDVTILNQQLDPGTLAPELCDAINEMVAANPTRIFLADCRQRLDRLRGIWPKCNLAEARRLVGEEHAEPLALAQTLHERFGKPAFVTAGPLGLAIADENQAELLPAQAPLSQEGLACGAGDTITARLAAALAAGASPQQAARFAIEIQPRINRG